MPSIYELKPRFQDLLRPLVRASVARGITPNHITLVAVLGSILAGGALAGACSNPLALLVLPAWLLVRMALNAMDGMAAREHGMQSSLGAVLNEVGDVVSDLALYLPLACFGPNVLWPVIAFCLGATISEFAGVLGQALGGRRRYDGPMGKSDRALAIGLLALATACFPRIIEWWPAALGLAALLTIVTTANRLRAALRELAASPRP